MSSENKNEMHGSNNGSVKGKLVWSLVFVAIAALTVFAVTSQKEFTLKSFMEFIRTLNPFWFSASVLAMLSFIVFEMLAIKIIIKDFGFNRPFRKCFIYSTSDIYFSAITPSSTGGQPASAYFMMKDGISGALSTVSLVINLIMYSFAIIIIGIIAFILKPSVFLSLSGICQILVAVGSFCIVGLAALLILVIYKGEILHKIGDAGLVLLARLHLIKRLDKKKAKLAKAIKSYNGYCDHMRGRAPMIIKALICNVIQRASLISVTMFTYLASGGDPSMCVDIWVLQCMVVLGTNILPIPGAMGISDFMLISSFAAIGFEESVAMNLNLVSRGISFYSCVIICGISLLIRIFGGMLINRNNKIDNKK